MAASIIRFDATKSPMLEVATALRQIRDGRQRLANARAVMISYCDGDTGVAADWDQRAASCGFQTIDVVQVGSAVALNCREQNQ